MASFISYVMEDYEFNWHHLHLIRKLEKLQRKEIKRLMVFMPPRHGKSQLVSRFLPSWIFGQNPQARIIATSYSADLASAMNRDVQQIMLNDEYAELFPEVALNETGNRSRRNSTTFDIPGSTGHYLSAGVGGPITGKGADYALIDDPIKNQEEAESKTYRDKLYNWYVSTLYTRLEKDACVLITLTRWHEDDLAGRLLKLMEDDNEFTDEWTIVDFPALKEDDSNPDDPRAIGEALWQSKYDEDRLQGIKTTIGSRYWNALYGQNPVTEGGNIIKGDWFRTYNKNLIEPYNIKFYLDSAFTSKSHNDPSGILAYFEHERNLYLINYKSVRMGFTALVKFLGEYVASFGLQNVDYLKIEPKASGQDIADYLISNSNINVVEDDAPVKDKETRTYSSTPYIEGGRVLIPEGDGWVKDFITSLEAFPHAKHDEEVDCLNGAVKDVLKDDDDIWMVGVSNWR